MKKMETVNNFKMTDCGRYGKAGEMNVKIYLNGERGNSRKVSAKGKTDVQYHGYKIEIKSNCGELDGIEKNDFVIYTMTSRKNGELFQLRISKQCLKLWDLSEQKNLLMEL